MSEDFDREAEKERLREKLETEEADRRSTEHMSELLLKGATMTNSHCEECGDPIFRYDGREFCPTCQEYVDEATGSQDVEATNTGAEPTDAPPTDESERTQLAETTETANERSEGQQSRSRMADASTQADRKESPRRQSAARTGDVPRSAGSDPGTIGDARASLVRTLSTLAAQAEDATDVRRTRDILSAAREAAEAIAALDRADR